MNDFIHSMQPIHWLAIAVFIGAASISSAIYTLASELRKPKYTSIKSHEANALDNIGHFLMQIRDSLTKLETKQR